MAEDSTTDYASSTIFTNSYAYLMQLAFAGSPPTPKTPLDPLLSLRTEFHFSTSGDIYATHLAEPPATHQEGGDTVQQVELHGISAQLPVYLSTKLTYSGDTVTIEVALQQPGNATLTLQYFLAGDGVKLLSGSVDSPPGNGTPPFLTIAMKMCDAVLTETLSGPLPLRSPATWQAPGVKVDNSPYVAAVLSGIGRATARMADCLIDLLEHPH